MEESSSDRISARTRTQASQWMYKICMSKSIKLLHSTQRKHGHFHRNFRPLILLHSLTSLDEKEKKKMKWTWTTDIGLRKWKIAAQKKSKLAYSGNDVQLGISFETNVDFQAVVHVECVIQRNFKRQKKEVITLLSKKKKIFSELTEEWWRL